jgi:hypothetical protein
MLFMDSIFIKYIPKLHYKFNLPFQNTKSK